jgi:cell wall-associated NlpC family hydrolase
MTVVGNISSLQNVLSRIGELERMGRPESTQFSQVLGNVTGAKQASGSAVTSGIGQPAGGVLDALKWADTQVGTKYAAVNPFRFGDVPWDGGSHTSVNGSGTVFRYPAGTKVYDCSGFATAVWRKAGVDLADYNATTSRSMLSNIPKVDPSQAVAGDLVILNTDEDGTADHVGILDGTGRMIDCQPTRGVQYREVKWDQVLGVVRPSLLPGANVVASSSGNNAAIQQAMALLQGTSSSNSSLQQLTGLLQGNASGAASASPAAVSSAVLQSQLAALLGQNQA